MILQELKLCRNSLLALTNFTIRDDGCWEWNGTPALCGYGRLSLGGIRDYVHRWVWKLFVGPIPDDMYICHTCDNRLCINLDHMFLGTHSDNLKDMHRKGRAYKRKVGDAKHGNKEVA